VDDAAVEGGDAGDGRNVVDVQGEDEDASDW
jgi:hypothetical protein